mmetsp:Transcript_71492/g.149466  ORF Transcript_71492/g.149466 Transcript_71492/m.149466 type:complete len:412 (+) Transcript_71492:189-1424(+)
MAFLAANLLGALGPLANFAQVADLGVSHKHQHEQMQWTRRAYRLDARTLRIDLLNAVKEDVRDHHNTHAGRIDTLLLVHTLLLTFALATLQFSDQYVPKTADKCPDCVEARYPTLVSIWVYLIAAILILPFWCILMLLWCKLQLDRWLELSVRRLNYELRQTLQSDHFNMAHTTERTMVDAAASELENVEQAIARLGGFVADHQDRFAKVWSGECETMVNVTTNLLWVNAVVAVSITAGMFWMFLRNNLSSHHRVATHFVILVVAGLLAPLGYLAFKGIRRARKRKARNNVEDYLSCGSEVDEEQAVLGNSGDEWTPSLARRISRGPAYFAAALRRTAGSEPAIRQPLLDHSASFRLGNGRSRRESSPPASKRPEANGLHQSSSSPARRASWGLPGFAPQASSGSSARPPA